MKANKVIDRQKYLSDNVARFFEGPQGSAALKGLEELYCNQELFHQDLNEMVKRVSEHDLIMNIKRTVEEKINE